MLKNNMTLEYTAPFFLRSDSNEDLLNIDKIGISNQNTIDRELFVLLKTKLSLDEYGETIPSLVAKELISKQYDVCLNYIYSNPIWEKLRGNKSVEILFAYIIETRHYLLAASSRMSAGLAFTWQTTPMSFILTEHLIEEADHAVFFENALVNMGCDKEVISKIKPSPITYEWIFLMRAISSRSSLVSAICSGLMESSAKDKDAVKGWHDLLISNKILKSKTVEKFYEHVELDIKLGHGSCWEEVLLSNSYITSDSLKEALNAVTIVAEMLDRWFTSLDNGLSGIIIKTAPSLIPKDKKKKDFSIDSFFNGNPIFSSTILNNVSHERPNLTDNVSVILGYKYFINGNVSANKSNLKQILNVADSFTTNQLLYKIPKDLNKNSLLDIVRNWMISIDGHLLWNEMIESPTEDLAFGFILENYHYINSSIAHTSAVIYSCPIEDIRNDFIKHLSEEENHGEILRNSLNNFQEQFFNISNLRPLSTTVAFVGFLKELAISDWKAYSIALAFLQLTLDAKSDKHKKFYKEASRQNEKIESLLNSIKKHDELDSGLNHEEDVFGIISKLEKLNLVSIENIQRASLVCSLCWSFLDGIRVHYKKNNSVNQRIGWSYNEISWN